MTWASRRLRVEYNRGLSFAGLALLASCATPRTPERLIALEATLAAHDSATLALERWCAVQGLADPSDVRAEAIAGPPASLHAAGRMLMGIGPEEPLGYRHVRLSCGDTLLSTAQNWFVPARLPVAMREALETTSQPFGKVIAPLGFRRERIASLRGRGEGCPRDTVLTQIAVLRLPDGQVISYLIECYDRALLGRGRSGARGLPGPPPG